MDIEAEMWIMEFDETGNYMYKKMVETRIGEYRLSAIKCKMPNTRRYLHNLANRLEKILNRKEMF